MINYLVLFSNAHFQKNYFYSRLSSDFVKACTRLPTKNETVKTTSNNLFKTCLRVKQLYFSIYEVWLKISSEKSRTLSKKKSFWLITIYNPTLVGQGINSYYSLYSDWERKEENLQLQGILVLKQKTELTPLSQLWSFIL